MDPNTAKSSEQTGGWAVATVYERGPVATFQKFSDGHVLVWPTRELAEEAGRVFCDPGVGHKRTRALAFAVIEVPKGTKTVVA